MTTSLWKYISCLVFALFLTGCVGGGGGGGGSAASGVDSGASSGSYMSLMRDVDSSGGDFLAPELTPETSDMSFSRFAYVPDEPQGLEGPGSENTVPSPEPTSMVLLGIGLGGMALLKRRQA